MGTTATGGLVPILVGIDGRIETVAVGHSDGGTSIGFGEVRVSRGPVLRRKSARSLEVIPGSVIRGVLHTEATPVEIDGEMGPCDDWAVWQQPSPHRLVASRSFSSPPSGLASPAVVGGFYVAGPGRARGLNQANLVTEMEILPASLWDSCWRPGCSDPRGMVCVDGRFWCDIYPLSATAVAGDAVAVQPSSQIYTTIADLLNRPIKPLAYGGNGVDRVAVADWFAFAEVATSFGKRLPSLAEFSAAAFGAPEQSSRLEATASTAWERISSWGVAQATGVIYQWGSDMAMGDGADSANQTGTRGRGTLFGADQRVGAFGGDWGSGAHAGSRCCNMTANPWDARASWGARLFCSHVEGGI